MYRSFKKSLPNAEGRSEFVIAVNADIRGFSAFSTINESPNIAMFIKRFYLHMIDSYFSSARFMKPTGDGLLMTFPYSERDLMEVSATVISSCFRCLQEFPDFCKHDPMINFGVPDHIGFGIARGTACCLFAGNRILDYSGHLLNLCSRLMELARPGGIVIDGNYGAEVIPEALRESFKPQDVFLRSIAEEKAITVLALTGHVRIPDSYSRPIAVDVWSSHDREIAVRQLMKVTAAECCFELKKKATSSEKIRLVMVFHPKTGAGGLVEVDFPFAYRDQPHPQVTVDTKLIQEYIKENLLAQNAKIKFRIDYVPKQ